MRYTVYWSQDIAPAARKLPDALDAESTVVGTCGDRWEIEPLLDSKWSGFDFYYQSSW